MSNYETAISHQPPAGHRCSQLILTVGSLLYAIYGHAYLEIMTSYYKSNSINVYLLRNNHESCQTSSRSDLKWWSLRLF